MNTTNNNLKKEISKSDVSLSKISKTDYQKEGTATAEIRQVITTTTFYPAAQVESSHQDNIFGAEDFGFEEKPYSNDEIRVAWLDIPEGTTEKQMNDRLDSFPNACLYKILSNQPIFTESQEYAIQNPDLDVSADKIAEKQLVRDGETGELLLDNNGKPQYRRVFFSSTAKEDMDLRTEDASFYATPSVKAEMAEKVSEDQATL